jgi:WXG100 family type VII secretion target
MSSEILLKAADARSVATDGKAAATETTDTFESLRSRLGDLADSFRGESAIAFDEKYQEWAESARALIEALDGLGTFLDGAATTIEDTDTQIAAQLRG